MRLNCELDLDLLSRRELFDPDQGRNFSTRHTNDTVTPDEVSSEEELLDKSDSDSVTWKMPM